MLSIRSFNFPFSFYVLSVKMAITSFLFKAIINQPNVHSVWLMHFVSYCNRFEFQLIILSFFFFFFSAWFWCIKLWTFVLRLVWQAVLLTLFCFFLAQTYGAWIRAITLSARFRLQTHRQTRPNCCLRLISRWSGLLGFSSLFFLRVWWSWNAFVFPFLTATVKRVDNLYLPVKITPAAYAQLVLIKYRGRCTMPHIDVQIVPKLFSRLQNGDMYVSFREMKR